MDEQDRDQGSSCSSNLDFSGLDIVDGKPVKENDKGTGESTAEALQQSSVNEIAESAEAEVAKASAEADTAVAKAEADARVAEAEAKAEVAAVKAEGDIAAAKQAANAKVAAEKSKRRSKSFKRIKRKLTVKVVIAVVVVLAVVGIAGTISFQLSKPTEFINSSQLTKIVAVNKLSVLDFAYDGVAEYTGNGHEDNPLHINYTATFKATFDPAEIKYEIDNDAKTVTPILPEISISSPNTNDQIDILEGDDQNVDLAPVYNACKDDAAAEVEEKSNIKDIALNNARKAVEGLSMNLLDSKGYKIVWPDGTTDPLQEVEGENNAA